MSEWLTADEVCRILGVCRATVRNWVRTGKLTAAAERPMLFDADYIKKYEAALRQRTDGALRSRRNKTKISGSEFYEAYICADANAETVRQMLCVYTRQPVAAVICNAALQLLLRRSGNLLVKYTAGRLPMGKYDCLLRPLIKGLPQESLLLQSEIYDYTLTFVPFEDTLGLLYICLKGMNDRKMNGVYYTPRDVVIRCVDSLSAECELCGRRILDPCCGTGNFLLYAGEKTGSVETLYGYDIDKTAIETARLNLALNFEREDYSFLFDTLRVCDTLSAKVVRPFDIVVGNPPWGSRHNSGQNVLSDTKESDSRRKVDSADAFTAKALSFLAPGGCMTFVVPQALFSVSGHDAVRRLLLNRSFLYVEYIEKGFYGVCCPCVAFTLKDDGRGECDGCRVIRGKREYTVHGSRLSLHRFNFDVTDEEAAVLQTMESGQRVYLRDNAEFALGIVTGDNRRHLHSVKQEGMEPVYKGSDIGRFTLSQPSSFIRFTPELFQQTAKESVYRTRQKLLYRFISGEPVVALDREGVLSLNSCNILIPENPALSALYIMAILNSSAAAFYFKKKFAAVKVLKTHLESIPLPAADGSTVARIEQAAQKLSEGFDEALFDELDREVSKLYGLPEDTFSK